MNHAPRINGALFMLPPICRLMPYPCHPMPYIFGHPEEGLGSGIYDLSVVIGLPGSGGPYSLLGSGPPSERLHAQMSSYSPTVGRDVLHPPRTEESRCQTASLQRPPPRCVLLPTELDPQFT